MFTPLLVARLIVILGAVNLFNGILIFFSCRCLPGSRIGQRLMKFSAYQRFFRYHCHIWKVFWASVVVHTVLALWFYGWPG